MDFYLNKTCTSLNKTENPSKDALDKAGNYANNANCDQTYQGDYMTGMTKLTGLIRLTSLTRLTRVTKLAGVTRHTWAICSRKSREMILTT